MATYASQLLIIGNTPVAFEESIIYKDPFIVPALASFRVEGSPIRMMSDGNDPTQAFGQLAYEGDWIEIISEKDINKFLVVSADVTKTAICMAQFADLEGEN